MGDSMDLIFIGNVVEVIFAVCVGVFFGMAYFSKKFRKKYPVLKDKYKLWYLLGLIVGILATIIRFRNLLK
jgi:hypothetical protein